MSYDISYYTKETWDKPYEERILLKVFPHKAEGGTVKANIIDGELVPAEITECDMNITYNYSEFYYKHIDKKKGIRWIYGKTGLKVKKRLEKAIKELGTDRNKTPFWQINTDYTIGAIFRNVELPISKEKHKEYLAVKDWDVHPDKKHLIEIGYLKDGGSYWKATPGNAGHALMRILTWIVQHPDGIFNGD